MIAIVSPILAVLTIAVMVWMTSSIRSMRKYELYGVDGWEVFQNAGWIVAVGSSILAIALFIHNPPNAVWEYPLLWIQALGLLPVLLFAGLTRTIVANYRRRRRQEGAQTQMGYLQPSGK